MKLLIVGGGFMGTALARHFSKFTNVILCEKNDEQLKKLKENPDLKKVTIVKTLTKEMEPEIIIEAVPEKLDLKKQVYSELETIFSNEVIICTNTSSFRISDLANELVEKERFVGTHFFSPADIIPLVEVVPSKWTSKETKNKVVQFLKDTEKKPVALKREIEGFIANRLQSALAREAMSLVEKGIATPEEIDLIARWSIGLRLPFTGPIEQRDINGLDTHLAIAEYIYPTLENSEKPLKILKDHVANNELGIKVGKGFYNWENEGVNEYIINKNQLVEKLTTLLAQFEED